MRSISSFNNVSFRGKYDPGRDLGRFYSRHKKIFVPEARLELQKLTGTLGKKISNEELLILGKKLIIEQKKPKLPPYSTVLGYIFESLNLVLKFLPK